MHCKVPQCAVRRLREEAEETRLLPQPAPMRGSRLLSFPQGCHCATQTAFALLRPQEIGEPGASQGISGKKLPLARASA